MERKGLLQIGGQDVTVIGADLQVGDQAPEFTQQDQDWQPVDILAATQGKVRVITALPSLSTSVCDRETRRFNEEAASLGEKIVVVATSMDLPWSQKNWCAAARVENVMVVSDHMETDFGRKYGVLVKERRIHRRAVFVVDAEETLVYVEYLPALGEEPDYAAVLAAAQAAAK
jgi:thiol peroxidase